MKDKNWTDIVSKQGDLRHFASMAIRKSGKSEHTSAQEIDFLFRIAQTPQAIRGVVNLFSNAYDNEDYSYEGLVAMAKYMDMEV